MESKSIFESRECRHVRKVRQTAHRFVAVMICLYTHTWYVAVGRGHLRSLIVLSEDHLEALVTDLIQIDRELSAGPTDGDRFKPVNSSHLGAHTTSTLSGFLPSMTVPLSVNVYSDVRRRL